MNKTQLFFLLGCLLLASCYRVDEEIKPQLNPLVQEHYLKQLPSPFHPLSSSEKHQDWAKEYTIGKGFAGELDLYPAMNAFKRALFLSPPSERKPQLYYDTLLCYYLGQKYGEVIGTFEKGELRQVDPNFPPYHDLLVMLYDSYLHQGLEEQAEKILDHFQKYPYPETISKLSLFFPLIQGDIPTLSRSPELKPFLTEYNREKKSVGMAQFFNALVPGSGYFYLGQIQSGFTASLLNGLFIWAAVHFFQHGQVAAGIVTTSFEAGWYFGGIYGAGLEGKFYNERLYERLATPLMNERKLFPILMLHHAF